MWLEAVVVEPGGDGTGGKVTRNEKGTPQGGVISPLLANLFLHWFDALFHGPQGPSSWADARLVRYADDMVILAREGSGEAPVCAFRMGRTTLPGSRFGGSVGWALHRNTGKPSSWRSLPRSLPTQSAQRPLQTRAIRA